MVHVRFQCSNFICLCSLIKYSMVAVVTAGYDQSPAKQATPTSGGMAPASSGEVFSPVSMPMKSEESPTMMLDHQASQGGVSGKVHTNHVAMATCM